MLVLKFKDETFTIRVDGRIVKLAAGSDVEIEFANIEQKAWVIGEAKRIGLSVFDNPHGYKLDEYGQPVCEHCGNSTNINYLKTPNMVCWKCGMEMRVRKGGE